MHDARNDRPSPRWAVLGAGAISESFVPDLRQVGTVAAIWAPRQEAVADFAARHSVPYSSIDLASVLSREDVDVVYIATPPATHTPLALQALEAGKHVLIEKPMATSVADTRAIFEAARARQLFAMEAMWMKFNPLHRELMSDIADGLIGDVRYMRAGFGMPFPAGGSRWDAALGGSTVLDQGIYPVTLARWALGPIVKISAHGMVREGVDTTAHVTLEHEGGGVSQFVCSALAFADPSASVSGTRGWVEIPAMFWSSDTALLHAGSEKALFEEPDVMTRATSGHGFVPMIRSVQKAIEDGLLENLDHDQQATVEIAEILADIRDQIFAADGRS